MNAPEEEDRPGARHPETANPPSTSENGSHLISGSATERVPSNYQGLAYQQALEAAADMRHTLTTLEPLIVANGGTLEAELAKIEAPPYSFAELLAAPILGDSFDPVAVSYVSESDVARAALARVAAREGYRFDATRRAWLKWGFNSTGQPVWTYEPGKAADVARTLAVTVAAHLKAGDPGAEKGTKERLRADMRARYNTNAGVSALAGLMQSWAGREGNPVHITAAMMEATERDDHLWTAGRHFDLHAAGRVSLHAYEASTLTPHTRTAAIAPAFTDDLPLWDALIDAVFGDDDEAYELTMALFGLALTGHSNRVLGVFWGDSGTGKTSLLRIVSELLGDYAVEANSAILDAKGDGNYVHALQGRRLVWVDEGPREGHYALEHLKALTGGARRTTRDLYQSAVTWTPHFTLFFAANNAPQVADPALRARVRSVHFQGDPDRVRDAVAAIYANPSAWAKEQPGVLAWLMFHAGMYLADPATVDNPAGVLAELDELAREQDPVSLWLEERCTPGGETNGATLFEDFANFAKRMAWARVPTMTAWGRRLNELGYPARKTLGRRVRGLSPKGLAAGFVGLQSVPTIPAPTPAGDGSGTVSGGLQGELEANPPTTNRLVSGGLEPLRDSRDSYLLTNSESLENRGKYTTSLDLTSA